MIKNGQVSNPEPADLQQVMNQLMKVDDIVMDTTSLLFYSMSDYIDRFTVAINSPLIGKCVVLLVT